ncbi:ATP-binding protein [Desulfovibrio cuneatus]|uniref:ATP-binding protein n=1 Tax=Desulfovibrio cuneatus TaxID=159728 RepID=UPI000688896B|nr:ATP-binding protein [Desulfovibrio cuneatus]
MNKNNMISIPAQELEEMQQELHYLRQCAQSNIGKILQLDLQAVALRHELEQKRRGFHLMAELSARLGHRADQTTLFASVSERINSALDMQRTVVLTPAKTPGHFEVAMVHGYDEAEAKRLTGMPLSIAPSLLDKAKPMLVTSQSPASLEAPLRKALGLPYFITVPVLAEGEIAALLITGRIAEELPFLPQLGHSDVETVQAVSIYLAAMLSSVKLMEAEERTQIMLDANPMCCNFWNERLENIDCNAEAPRLFDLANKQEYLDRFFELSPEFQPCGRPTAEMAYEYIQTAFAKGRVTFEWMHQKLNGDPVPAEITLIRGKRSEETVVLGYTRDLRELKAMLAEMQKKEEQLRLARDLAEKNAQAKSEFLANMSHEIRTPMNAILGMTHILAETELTEKQALYVQKAEYSAKLLLHIINDILDFSKIEAGKLVLENTSFSLPAIMGQMQDILSQQAKDKDLSFTTTIAQEVPANLVGDPLRLEQVLLNLSSNAIKFTQNGSVHVAVSLHTPPATPDEAICLRFSVQDTGIGLQQEQINSLFTPFTQADSSTTRKYGGTGLGLAISRSLVELMGGTIQCESTAGQGSTFSFTAMFTIATESPAHQSGLLPDALAAAEATLQGNTQSPPNDKEKDTFEDLAGLRVLLTEDNDINQMIALDYLESKSIQAHVANNGREALEALEKGTYDLILMDIQMPEMDGLTATRHIRKNPAHATLPIIAMTAHAMVGDYEASLQSGMNDHITKPIDPQVLFATLRKWRKQGS